MGIVSALDAEVAAYMLTPSGFESTAGKERKVLRARKDTGVSRSVRIYVFIGPPGAGKGTMATMVCQDYGFAHVSTGQALREEGQSDSSLGRQVRPYLESGRLAPDELVAKIVAEHLRQQKPVSSGVILDGYPRNVPQAEMLEQLLEESQLSLTAVIYFEVNDDLLVRRLTARLLCNDCGAVFNARFNPPAKPGVCDRCGGELSQRSDDREETVRHRLQVFHSQTAPLADYYQERGLLRRVPGDGAVDQNYAALREAL